MLVGAGDKGAGEEEERGAGKTRERKTKTARQWDTVHKAKTARQWNAVYKKEQGQAVFCEQDPRLPAKDRQDAGETVR